MRNPALSSVTRPGIAATLLPIAAILGSILSLTVGSSFAKRLFPLVGAQGTVGLRVTFAALLLCAIWRPWRRRLTLADARTVALYGAVLGAMNLCFYMSLRTIPIGIAIAIEFSGPLAVAIASSRRPIDFAWIGFAALGLGLLLPLGQASGTLDPVGVGYVLCAAVFWALYIIYGTRVGHLHGGQVVSLGMATAAVVVLPFAVARAGAALWNPAILAFGLVVAILSSAIPYSLEMIALQRLPKQTFGILLSLEPAAGAIAALVILGEQLTGLQWLAIGCIMVASAGSTMTASWAGPRPALRRVARPFARWREGPRGSNLEQRPLLRTCSTLKKCARTKI